ncbi:MAG TPA: hypothetical protein VIJ63_16140 [Roseiarcus sp.]
MQLKGELRANESKGIQGKLLVFPWIPLAESGLFKGLQRIQIKKGDYPGLDFSLGSYHIPF